MTEIGQASLVLSEAEDRSQIRRLMYFFALVYVAEGMGQTSGLIAQPLNYYLKEIFGWTPVQITAYLTILNIPWFIKPLYGIFSDFVPLFGYRRKSYLILANAVAALAYVCMSWIAAPGSLIFFLLLTACGMAISSTLCGAVLVENGQRFRASGAFVNQQWLWYNIAAVAASLLGGLLIEKLTASSALHVAAVIVGLTPIGVIFGSILLIEEEKTAINVDALRRAFHGFLGTFRSKHLWIIALFLFFYNFSPGFYTPLYFYMTNELKFSQGYIGVLGSISSAGWIVGGLIYHRFLQKLTSKDLLNLSIVLGVIGTLVYLMMWGEIMAAIVNFVSGVAGMITFVASLTLAADYCPKKSEGFSYAILMSVSNFAASASDNLGSYLYEHVFSDRLAPLIVVSAAFTAFAFVLVPMLHLGRKRQGQPIDVVAGEWGVDSEHPHVGPGR